MEQCPIEIWMRIFSLACTDEGNTGRSLSQVSRYVHQISSPVKLQSVVLIGVDQLHAFADMLERTQAELRRVRHLCVSHHNLSTSKYRAIGLTGRRKVFEEQLTRVLGIVAPTLQSLTLNVGALWPLVLHIVDFPILEELTLQGSFLLPPTLLQDGSPVVQPFPSLKRLHLLGCSDFFLAFIGQAPRLTHLRLTGAMSFHQRTREVLFKMLFPSEEESSFGEHGESAEMTDFVLPHIERIIIQPPSGIAIKRMTRTEFLRNLARSDKLVILRVDSVMHAYDFSKAKQHWLERIEGEDGCWRTGIVEVERLHRSLAYLSP